MTFSLLALEEVTFSLLTPEEVTVSVVSLLVPEELTFSLLTSEEVTVSVVQSIPSSFGKSLISRHVIKALQRDQVDIQGQQMAFDDVGGLHSL